VLARQADVVYITGALRRGFTHRAAHLGRDNYLVALSAAVFQSLAQDRFRLAVGIDISRVEEVDASLQTTRHHLVPARLIDDGDVQEVAAEGHRAQAQLGNLQPGTSQ